MAVKRITAGSQSWTERVRLVAERAADLRRDGGPPASRFDTSASTPPKRHVSYMGPSIQRFVTSAAEAGAPLRKKSGAGVLARDKRAASGEILARIGHAVHVQTELRAIALLKAARATAKERPRGFPDEKQFAQRVADIALGRFSLDMPLRGSAVRASRTYWPVIKDYYKFCRPETIDPPRDPRRKLPDAREALDALKPLSLAYPKFSTTDIFRRAFGKRNTPLSEISQHIGRLCEGEGKDAGELRVLIERHMKSRSSIAWRRIKGLRAEFSAACRGVIHPSETQSIVGQMRGGADEMRLLIEVVNAGYRWSVQRIIFHGMNRDYLVLYRLRPIRGGEEFCILYADTRLDYSTVRPEIPKEPARRKNIIALAGNGSAFPNTRFVVFAGEGWDKKTAVEANIPAVGAGQRDIKELESAIERARQAVGKLQATAFASMRVGSDLTNLTLTLYLAGREKGAQRDRRIGEGIAAVEGLIAKITERAGSGGGPAGGAKHLMPASRSLVFGDGLPSGIAGAWAFATSPVMPCPSVMSAFQFTGARLF